MGKTEKKFNIKKFEKVLAEAFENEFGDDDISGSKVEGKEHLYSLISYSDSAFEKIERNMYFDSKECCLVYTVSFGDKEKEVKREQMTFEEMYEIGDWSLEELLTEEIYFSDIIETFMNMKIFEDDFERIKVLVERRFREELNKEEVISAYIEEIEEYGTELVDKYIELYFDFNKVNKFQVDELVNYTTPFGEKKTGEIAEILITLDNNFIYIIKRENFWILEPNISKIIDSKEKKSEIRVS